MNSELCLLSQYLNDIALERSGIFKIYPRRFVLLNNSVSNISDIDSELDSIRNATYTTDINGLDSEEKKWQAIKNITLENIIGDNTDSIFGGEIIFLSENAGIETSHFFHEIVLNGSEIINYSVDSESIYDDPSKTIFRPTTDTIDSDYDFTQIAILYDVGLVSDGIEMVIVASDILLGFITFSEALIGTNWTIRILIGNDGASTIKVESEKDTDIVIKNLIDCAIIAGNTIDSRPEILDDLKADIAEIKNNSKENVPYLRNDGWYVNGKFMCSAIFGTIAIQLRELLGDLTTNWDILSDFISDYDSWLELIELVESNKSILSNLENILLGENVVAFNAVTVLTESDSKTNNTILTISAPYQFTEIAFDSETITADSEINSFTLETDSNLEINITDQNEIMLEISDEFIEELLSDRIIGGGIVTVTETSDNYIISAYAFDTVYINNTSTVINASDNAYVENSLILASLCDNLLINLDSPKYESQDSINFYYKIIFSFSDEYISLLNTTYTAKNAINITNNDSEIIISTPFAFRKIKYNNKIVYLAKDSSTTTLNIESENLIVTINDHDIDITMAAIPLIGTGISGDLYEHGIDEAIDTYFNMDNYAIFSVFVITSEYRTRYVWWYGADSATEIYNVNGGFFSKPNSSWSDTDNITWSIDATDFSDYYIQYYEFKILYYEEENFFLLQVGYTQNNETTYTYYMNWENIPKDSDNDGYLRDSDYFNTITVNNNYGTVKSVTAKTDILFHDGYYVYQWNGETFESISHLSDAVADVYDSMPEESDLEFTYKFLGEDVWEE